MARAGAPRIARREQNVCRRICPPVSRWPVWQLVESAATRGRTTDVCKPCDLAHPTPIITLVGISRLVGLVILMATAAAAAQGQPATSGSRVSQLLAQLTSDDPTVRGAAAMDLQTVRGPAAVPPLIVAANTGTEAVRGHAIRALGRLGASAAIPDLVGLLRHPSSDVRGDTRDALAALGVPAIRPLILLMGRADLGSRQEFVDSDNVDWRGEAALTLAAVGPAAIDPLRRALRSAVGDTRRYVLAALALIDDARASDAIAGEGASADPERRQDAIAAVEEALSILTQPDKVPYGQAEAIAPRLVAVINGGHRDPVALIRVQALRSTAGLAKSDAMFPLAFDLSLIADNVAHGDVDVREAAISALEHTGLDAAAAARLTALGLAPDPVIREAAGRALATRPAGWTDAIEVATDGRQDVEARLEAIDAIENAGQGARDALVPLLEDDVATIRAAAARAFGRIESGAPDSPAVGALVSALEAPDRDVREAAVEALVAIGQGVGTTALATLLTDPDRGVQRSAIEAVGQAGCRGGGTAATRAHHE